MARGQIAENREFEKDDFARLKSSTNTTIISKKLVYENVSPSNENTLLHLIKKLIDRDEYNIIEKNSRNVSHVCLLDMSAQRNKI